MRNLNINENVIVKLNEIGKVAWEKHAKVTSSVFVDPVLYDSKYNRVMKKLKNDTLEAPLWEIMSVYGPYMEKEEDYPFASEFTIGAKSFK